MRNEKKKMIFKGFLHWEEWLWFSGRQRETFRMKDFEENKKVKKNEKKKEKSKVGFERKRTGQETWVWKKEKEKVSEWKH